MSAITTHVLDTSTGAPAAGIHVRLETGADNTAENTGAATDSGWRELATGVTDADGRIRDLGPDQVPAGHYRLTFDTGRYFADRDQPAFFPEVTVAFAIADPEAHHHIPILLSPFSYSTYRGS